MVKKTVIICDECEEVIKGFDGVFVSGAIKTFAFKNDEIDEKSHFSVAKENSHFHKKCLAKRLGFFETPQPFYRNTLGPYEPGIIADRVIGYPISKNDCGILKG